jgi:prepilin-type N-terminal cleavage/methylation domain-containing protein
LFVPNVSGQAKRFHFFGGVAMKVRAGFTMIELMMVLVILAILAAVAVPVYQSLVSRSKAAELTTACAVIKDAVDVYRAQRGVSGSTVPNYSDLTSEMLVGSADFEDMKNIDEKKLADGTVTIIWNAGASGVDVTLSGDVIAGDLASDIDTFTLKADGTTAITRP